MYPSWRTRRFGPELCSQRPTGSLTIWITWCRCGPSVPVRRIYFGTFATPPTPNCSQWRFPFSVLFANRRSGRGPRDRPEQVIADPELKQPVGHQDVASAASIVLADTDVLRVDAHDAVRRHPA